MDIHEESYLQQERRLETIGGLEIRIMLPDSSTAEAPLESTWLRRLDGELPLIDDSSAHPSSSCHIHNYTCDVHVCIASNIS